MDLNLLAAHLTQMLAPFVPALVGASKEFAGGMVKGAGSTSFELIKTKLWERLQPVLHADPRGSLVVEQLAEAPDSPDFRRSFMRVLQSVLERDPALAAELAQIATPETVQRVVAESRSDVGGVDQSSTGAGRTTQEVQATDGSRIIGVRQQKT